MVQQRQQAQQQTLAIQARKDDQARKSKEARIIREVEEGRSSRSMHPRAIESRKRKARDKKEAEEASQRKKLDEGQGLVIQHSST